jgi:hypothetical protein
MSSMLPIQDTAGRDGTGFGLLLLFALQAVVWLAAGIAIGLWLGR